jgi:peptidoglycan/LPS O-acetylase OafA/YrhL
VVLVVAPFVEAKENVLTGMVLLAFALGWALLAVLSIRFSDQPQRWAAAPAVFFALAGLISLLGSDTVRHVFGWVWPPVLLGLVVWMIIPARKQLHSRTRWWRGRGCGRTFEAGSHRLARSSGVGHRGRGPAGRQRD